MQVILPLIRQTENILPTVTKHYTRTETTLEPSSIKFVNAVNLH